MASMMHSVSPLLTFYQYHKWCGTGEAAVVKMPTIGDFTTWPLTTGGVAGAAAGAAVGAATGAAAGAGMAWCNCGCIIMTWPVPLVVISRF